MNWFQLYENEDGMLTLTIEDDDGGFRIGGAKLQGRSYPSAQFTLDDRAREEILRRLGGR
jgi:hypothetical protein